MNGKSGLPADKAGMFLVGLSLSAANMVDDIAGQKSIMGFFSTTGTGTSGSGPDAGSDADPGADPGADPDTTTIIDAVLPITASGISSRVVRHTSTVRAGPDEEDVKWACIACTFLNDVRDGECAMCGGATTVTTVTTAAPSGGGGADSTNPPPAPKRVRMSATERIAHVRSERGIGKYF